MKNFVLRRAEARDFDAVAAIRAQTIPGDYFETTFHEERVNAHYYFAVLEADHQVLGYAVMEFTSPDAALTEVAVSPIEQRQGHATRLWQHLLQQAQWRNVKRVFLEVRQGNRAALNWYKKLGFVEINQRQQYYSDPIEDAVVMKYSVSSRPT